MISIKTKIGIHLVEATGANMKEAIEAGSLLAELPRECGNCQSDQLAFHHRSAQNGTYHFYELVCHKCKFVYAIGQNKTGGGLFPAGPWEPSRYGSNESAPSQPYHGTAQQQADHYQQPAPQQAPQQAPPTHPGTPGN